MNRHVNMDTMREWEMINHPWDGYIRGQSSGAVCVVWGGTMLLLYAAKQLVLVIGGQA